MSNHVPGLQSFFSFLHHFVLAKFATSSVRVKRVIDRYYLWLLESKDALKQGILKEVCGIQYQEYLVARNRMIYSPHILK